MKSLRMPFVIYTDLDCLLVKQQSCQSNPDKTYIEQKAIHEPCGYSLVLISSFDSKENKHSFCRGKDCIKKFCKELRELARKIINYEQKEMDTLTDREKKYYENQKTCYISQKRFCYNKKQEKMYKFYRKVRDHCHFTGKFRGAFHSICNLRYSVPHEIPVKFRNGSTYDFHFIIKELAEEFKGEDFKCLAEKSEKYISFSVLIKKKIIDGTNEIIMYKIRFIDTFRFMSSGLSCLIDNLS